MSKREMLQRGARSKFSQSTADRTTSSPSPCRNSSRPNTSGQPAAGRTAYLLRAPHGAPTQFATQNQGFTPRELQPCRTVQQVHGLNIRLRREVRRLRYLSRGTNGHFRERLAYVLGHRVSPPLLDLLLTQVKDCQGDGRRRRWTAEVKSVCLAIRNRSSVAYKFLQNVLVLPSPKSLHRLEHQLPMNVGLSQEYVSHLYHLCDGKPDEYKYCSILFGEMMISKGVSYSAKEDAFVGFEDWGTHRVCAFADHALVFMIRGLLSNWKQPLCYYLSHGPVHQDTLRQIVQRVVLHIQREGFRVSAVVCDQGAANWAALRQLRSQSPQGFQTPYFFSNGEKILTFWDPPQLLKATRNNFMEATVHFAAYDGSLKSGEWALLRRTFEHDRHKELPIMWRITNDHFNPSRKITVKLAAQILSSNVAYCLLKYHVLNRGEQGYYLADFIDDVNYLFDSFNSRKGELARFRMPLGEETDHLIFWRIVRKRVNTWAFTRHGQVLRNHVREGWVDNIDAIQILWGILQESGFHELETRFLNLDPLENLFITIRLANGANNINPTPAQFVSGLSTTLLNGLDNVNGDFGCEADDADILSNLHNFVNESISASNSDRGTGYSEYRFDSNSKGYDEVKRCLDWITQRTVCESANPEHFLTQVVVKLARSSACTFCFKSLIQCPHPCIEGRVTCECAQPKCIVLESCKAILETAATNILDRAHHKNLLQELVHLSAAHRIVLACIAHQNKLRQHLVRKLCIYTIKRFAIYCNKFLRHA